MFGKRRRKMSIDTISKEKEAWIISEAPSEYAVTEALCQLGAIIDRLDKSIKGSIYSDMGTTDLLIFSTVAKLRNVYTRLGGQEQKWRND